MIRVRLNQNQIVKVVRAAVIKRNADMNVEIFRRFAFFNQFDGFFVHARRHQFVDVVVADVF